MLGFHRKSFVIVSVILSVAIPLSNGLPTDQEFLITAEQKAQLEKLRAMMGDKLTQPYMKQDVYLIKWLRSTNNNVAQAKQNLEDNLKWRMDNKIDNITQLDWTEFTKSYPYTTDVYDREGRPTFLLNIAKWNVRKAASGGMTQKLLLYWVKALEELAAKVRNLQKEGKKVTEGNLVVDMGDFSVAEHFCVQCAPVYTRLIALMQQRYPGDIHKSYLVDVPRIFELILQGIYPSGGTGDSFKVYGQNRDQWQRELSKDFEAEQLPVSFGGTNTKVTVA